MVERLPELPRLSWIDNVQHECGLCGQWWHSLPVMTRNKPCGSASAARRGLFGDLVTCLVAEFHSRDLAATGRL
jgi:hypothetical protein